MLVAAMHTGRSCSSLVACLALLAAAGCGSPVEPPRLSFPMRVLTWNLYLGTDLVPLAAVPTPAEIPPVAAKLWADVQASEIPARAKVIAARIAELAPDVVALQEVTLYRRQSPSDFTPTSPPNAIDVELDFLRLILDELAARGAAYRVAVEAPNADIELPVSDGAGGVFDLRVTDRDVILVTNVIGTPGQGTQVDFAARVNVPVGGAGGARLEIARSVSHIGATLALPFTIANTHLEVGELGPVQGAQANELLAAMAAVPGPVVLLGDFNTTPGASTYQALTKTFKDLGATLPLPATDPTCCQDPDLKNATSKAEFRIDLILTRGAFTMDALRPVGTDPVADRTPSGKWASDHFGVFSVLQLR